MGERSRPPAYGAERFTLVTLTPAEYVIRRLVWTDQGTTTFYDEEHKDFVTWPGSWQRVEDLGRGFPSREDARQFMIDRASREVAGAR